MATRSNKGKSYGLRMLWIPGRRKNHYKGRFDTTGKHYSYEPKQKKSGAWSLGGGRMQGALIHTELRTSLLEGPSTSCGIAAPAQTAADVNNSGSQGATAVVYSKDTETVTTVLLPPSELANEAAATKPINVLTSENTDNNNPTMDNNNKTDLAVNNAAKTLKELQIRSSKESSKDFDIYDFPRVPEGDINSHRSLVLHTTAETMTTVSTAVTATPTSPKSVATDADKDDVEIYKKKSNIRIQNSQGDINSIESLSDTNIKPLNTDLGWIDELYLRQNGNTLCKSEKKKNKVITTKVLDELDGVPSKEAMSVGSEEEDEKVVKCLYYTLMCCDCTIS